MSRLCSPTWKAASTENRKVADLLGDKLEFHLLLGGILRNSENPGSDDLTRPLEDQGHPLSLEPEGPHLEADIRLVVDKGQVWRVQVEDLQVLEPGSIPHPDGHHRGPETLGRPNPLRRAQIRRSIAKEDGRRERSAREGFLYFIQGLRNIRPRSPGLQPGRSAS